MALVNKIRAGANGFRKCCLSTSAFAGSGANTKTLLALPSLVPRQSGHKLGSDGKNYGGALALTGATVSGILCCTTVAYCDAEEQRSVCPYYPWPNKGLLSSSDPTLISSGKRAFQDSCAACHANLSLVANPCSNILAKAVITQIEVADDLKDKGGMLTTTATPNDQISCAYANKYGLRIAKGGTNIPDVTKFLEVMRINPCYSGGSISMRKMLSSCAVEYATPASVSRVG